MPNLEEAQDAHEDWTGLKDAKVRRKLQNRLNVRAYRKRKVMEAPTSRSVIRHRAIDSIIFYAGPSLGWHHGELSKPVGTLSLVWASPSLKQFYTAVMFPLSADHLIPLTQYNILRAALTNMWILSLFHTLPDKYHDTWGQIPLFPAPETIPDTLAPTECQQRKSHDIWIDLLPDAVMRDNVINAVGTFNQKDLCLDLIGRICQGGNTAGMMGILVWCDPWTPEGWEVTEGFAQKWGFLLKGCWRMLHATNKWRAQRGEEPIILDS